MTLEPAFQVSVARFDGIVRSARRSVNRQLRRAHGAQPEAANVFHEGLELSEEKNMPLPARHSPVKIWCAIKSCFG